MLNRKHLDEPAPELVLRWPNALERRQLSCLPGPGAGGLMGAPDGSYRLLERLPTLFFQGGSRVIGSPPGRPAAELPAPPWAGRFVEPGWWWSGVLDGCPMREVLRRRDIGGVFRFLKARGWSRAAIAAAAGLSETRVRAICQGKQKVTSYEVLERIAGGLGIERGLLGLAYVDDIATVQARQSTDVQLAHR